MRLGISLIALVLATGAVLPAGEAGRQKAALPVVKSLDVPHYPPEARGTSGIVRLELRTDGAAVATAIVVEGEPLFADAALADVRRWEFERHRPQAFQVMYRYRFRQNACDTSGGPPREIGPVVRAQLPSTVEVVGSDETICIRDEDDLRERKWFEPGSGVRFIADPPAPSFRGGTPMWVTRARVTGYPESARLAGVEGTVQVRVSKRGDVRVTSGPRELRDGVLNMVRGWTIEPPSDSDRVSVMYRLARRPCAGGSQDVTVSNHGKRVEIVAPAPECVR